MISEQSLQSGSGLRGTVTLLFTDVEGSTRLLQRFGDRSVRILEDHKAILRRTVAEYGGREVDNAGDGFFIAFDVARDALAAAVEAQRRLSAQVWPEGEAIRVRMGMHTGEPIVSGRTYLGLDVHRAARLCAAGHGGQILISATTRQLVMTDLPGGVALKALGEHRLKDLQHPEQIYQVVGAGLEQEFPPLRSAGPHQSNLPVPSSPLIGRDTELESLRGLLLDPRVRLVTLTGPGGTGKTRLALQVSGTLVDAFAEGVMLVQLAGTPDAALVPSAIAEALGIHPGADETPIDALLEQLQSRELLLILDNFEHLVGAAGVVAEVLAKCARVKLLVTSREALNLTAEREFPVPPLPAPDPARERRPERLRLYPAIELFAQRAAAVNPTFRLDDDGTLAVAEICHRLDGLPLAIELAAARVKIFPPRALLARLDRRLELLSGGARDMPVRHRTLRQAIGWSYDLLEASEQALFRRLAVFAGGCSFEAVEVVCERAGALPFSVLDGVSALVDRSLLQQVATAEGEPRFVMLETIREYALERLADSGEEAPTRIAHVDFCITVAEQAEPHLTGPMQMSWLTRLGREQDNVRAAFEHIERTSDAARGLRLAAALWRFWLLRGGLTEGRARLGAMLALGGDEANMWAVRLQALAGAATMAHEQGDLTEAKRLLDESLQIARAAGDRHMAGRTLTNLSWVQFHLGDHVQSRFLAEEGLAIHRELGDTRGVALALNNMGWSAMYEADYARALELHTASLSLRQQLGDARGIAFARINIAWVHVERGDFTRAEPLLAEAVDNLRALGDDQVLAYGLIVTAISRFYEDRFDQALELLEESLAVAREIGQLWDVTQALSLLVTVLIAAGQAERAGALAEQCRFALHAESPWLVGQAKRSLAEYNQASGAHQEAEFWYKRALATFAQISARDAIASCFAGLAQVYVARAEHSLAATLAAVHDTLRERTGGFTPPVVRRALDASLGSARTEMGDAAVTDAVGRGRQLSWQDALALVGLNGSGPEARTRS